jgi:hypothetical protein
LRFLFVASAAFVVALVAESHAHDLERTQVTIVFARDGSFVADVVNDRAWLALRLADFRGGFADRVVLWVDGHEVRPSSVEYIADGGNDADRPLARYRLRGRMPTDARTLRWYYGMVIDPYPLTIRRADGRILVEEIAGDAWSRTLDVSGQFQATRMNGVAAAWLVAGLLLVPVGIRLATKPRKNAKAAESAKTDYSTRISLRPWRSLR